MTTHQPPCLLTCDQLAEADYHQTPGITWHRLKYFLDHGPLHYRRRYVDWEFAEHEADDDKAWKRLGRAYHVFALQGEDAFAAQVIAHPETYTVEELDRERYDAAVEREREAWEAIEANWKREVDEAKAKAYAEAKEKGEKRPKVADMDLPEKPERPGVDRANFQVGVDKPWNRNADFCREWEAEHAAQGLLVLTPREYAQAVNIGRAMRDVGLGRNLLQVGWPEVSLMIPNERFPLVKMCRMDWVASTSTDPNDAFAIVDPKGVARWNGFERDAKRLGYIRQMAFYRRCWHEYTGKQIEPVLLAVEKSGAYRCRAFYIDGPTLDYWDAQNERDLDRLAEHFAANHWPKDHTDEPGMIVDEWIDRDPGETGGVEAVTSEKELEPW